MKEQIADNQLIFPEPHLQGYNGPVIKDTARGFNQWKNNRYLTS
jgi:hypothetical protein